MAAANAHGQDITKTGKHRGETTSRGPHRARHLKRASAAMFRPDLTIIMPAHNAAQHIEHTIETIFAGLRRKLELIVVNDGSTDSTAQILDRIASQRPEITVLSQPENLGAGAARNAGFAHATGKFTLFLDADDPILPGALDRLIAEANAANADVLIAPYFRSSDIDAERLPMHRQERRLWSRLPAEFERRKFRIASNNSILRISNYPWNKIAKTDFLRSIDFRFSNTKVHNDIFAHWHMLMNCETYFLSTTPILIHISNPRNSHITDISDSRRLDIFRALDEVIDVFLASEKLRNLHYSRFLRFSTGLCLWGLCVIDKDHLEEYKKVLTAVMTKAFDANYLRMAWYSFRVAAISFRRRRLIDTERKIA